MSGARGRLLAACAFPPWPVTNGYSLRVAHLLDGLVRGWRVTLLSPPVEDPGSWPAAERVADWRPIPLDVYGGPLATLPAHQGPMIAGAIRALERADHDVALLWGGTEFLVAELDRGPRVVWERIDCLTLQALRALLEGSSDRVRSLKSVFRWAVHERRTVRRVSATTVVGERDATVLRRLSPSRRSRIRVVPNGVTPRPFVEYELASDRPTVAFTGVLAYSPNVEAAVHFVREVWPRVRDRVEGARCVIAGRKPGPEVRALEREEGVEVWADVPSIPDVLARAWVVVAPMRSGSGIKNKVLEAWSVGRPVVMYPLAANGLELDERSAELVVEDRDAMARVIRRLLEDDRARREYARAAHRTAGSHSWESAVQKVDSLLVAAMESRA